MVETKILIVANDSEAGKAYSEALLQLDVACDLVPNFHDMSCRATEQRYSGLLIDILTLVRCSKEEKMIAYECMNLYPVLRVKWESKQKKMKLSPLEQNFAPDAESALISFIEKRCRSFPARQLRRHPRKPVNLNALLSPDGSFADQTTLKTFTLNLSREGFFLHTTQSFPVGQALWVRFLELADQTPIGATVRWAVEWGRPRCIAGVGLQFQTISEAQAREIEQIF